MLSEVSKDVFKVSGVSNIYFLKKYSLLIDTGSQEDKELLKKHLGSVVNLDSIKTVVFTHLHYDHSSNTDLFKNAKFYASKKEIDNFNKDALGTVLNSATVKNLKDIKLLEVTKEIIPEHIQIINVPGHTSGSIALYDFKNKILFSGDTLFYNLVIGRYDLPTSSPKDMNKSLEVLTTLNVDVLCPGHDY
jgi:hydroxyacylglutathione hydrolase